MQVVARRIIYWCSLLGLAFAIIEAASAFVFMTYLEDRLSRHWKVDAQNILSKAPQGELAEFRDQYFDPTLGWSFGPNTTAFDYATFEKDGSRRSPWSGLPAPVYAYGDSFTFGEDVLADETWPYFLSQRLGKGVKNFGVAGYGSDQALLRLRVHLQGGQRPKAVILAVLSENIARVVNVHRLMYSGNTGVLNFKPILRKAGEDTIWVPNPLSRLTEKEDVLVALQEGRQNDFWYEHNLVRPKLGFPYLWSALDTAHYLHSRILRWEDLWQMDRPVRTMRAVVREFLNLAEAHSFLPILVMIPVVQDTIARDQGKPWSYQKFIFELKKDLENSPVIIVDMLDFEFFRESFYIRPDGGHASPNGNQVIAKAIYERLKDNISLLGPGY